MLIGITYITESEMFVCDNCGAFADKEKSIQHFKNCQPGESKKWEEFYKNTEEEKLCIG